MSIQRVAGILAAAVAFCAAESAQAQTGFGPGGCVTGGNRNTTRIIDVNCTPTRVSMMRQPSHYYPMPMPVPYPVPMPYPVMMPPMGQNFPVALAPAAPPQAPPAPTPQPAAPVVQRPSPILPKEVNNAPAEPTVRMRYVEVSVAGLQSAADGDKLTAALDKLKGSRGATVKRTAGGDAVVKVWYSEKDPLQADAVIQAVSRLGFAASES